MLSKQAKKTQIMDESGNIVCPAGTVYITANSSTGSKYYDLVADQGYAAIREQNYKMEYSTVSVTDHTFTRNVYTRDTGALVDTYTIMGTMAKTQILAFVGSSLNSMLVIYSYNVPFMQLINMNQIGIEIIQGLSGSMAVILVVPIISYLTSRIITVNKSRI